MWQEKSDSYVPGERWATRSVEFIRAELADTTWKVTSHRGLRVPGRVGGRCRQGGDGSLWLRAGNTWLRGEG